MRTKKKKHEVWVETEMEWINEEDGSIVKSESTTFILETPMEAVCYMGNLIIWGYQRLTPTYYYQYDDGDYRDNIAIKKVVRFEEV